MFSIGGEYFSKDHEWTFIAVSEQNNDEKWLSYKLGV